MSNKIYEYIIMRMNVSRTHIFLDLYDYVNQVNFEIKFLDGTNTMAKYTDITSSLRLQMQLHNTVSIRKIIDDLESRKYFLNTHQERPKRT